MENDRKHCEYLYLLCPIPFYSILSPHNSNNLIRILEVKESERSSDLPFPMYKLYSIMYILYILYKRLETKSTLISSNKPVDISTGIAQRISTEKYAFKLWCWRVPWTARRSNQSILKEINPEYSLEELMLKLNLQYFGHLLWWVDSLGKTLMLGRLKAKGEGGSRGWDG